MDNASNEFHSRLDDLFNIHGQRRNQRTFTQQDNSETRLLHTLCDIMLDYNANIRTYNENQRIYETNMSSFLRFFQNNFSRRQGAFQGTARMPTFNRGGTFTYARPTRLGRATEIYTNLFQDTVTNTLDHILPTVFANVTVRPSEEQIQLATRTFDYHDNEGVNSRCPITLEDFQMNEPVCQIIHCGHTFKPLAIQNWFRQNVRCPVCRYDIRDYVLPTGTRDETTEPGGEDSPVDVSGNNVEEPIAELNLAARNFGNMLTTILHNYIQEEMDRHSTDLSNAPLFTFDIPLVFYNDNSGNTVRI
jgi:hypothetical protein